MKRLRHQSPEVLSAKAAAAPRDGLTVNFRFPREHNAYSLSVLEDLRDAKKARAFDRLRSGVADIWRPEFEDDFYLFRWLKARQFDSKKAEQMLRAHIEWRKEFGADTILEDFEMPPALAEYYTGGFCGFDSEDRPVWYDPIGKNDPEGLARSATREELIRSRIYVSEWTCRCLLPRRRAETGRAVYQLAVVYDMAEFGRRQMWPPSLDLFLELTRICEANYPETMGTAFIINAPALFPALFNMLKPLLHKDTQSKIHVLGDNFSDSLPKYIPPDQLPACYGGLRRDPDGNPQCASSICFGGQVPPDFYLRPCHAGRMEQVVVGRRSAHKVELLVMESQAPASIEWEFVTEDGDIGFEVYLTPSDADQARQHVVQLGRVESDLRPCSGRTVCRLPGCYVAKFDNGHSWTRAKRLSYYLELLPLAQQELPLRASPPRVAARQGASRLRFIPPGDLPAAPPAPSPPVVVPLQVNSSSSLSAAAASAANGSACLTSYHGSGSQESFHTACSHLSAD